MRRPGRSARADRPVTAETPPKPVRRPRAFSRGRPTLPSPRDKPAPAQGPQHLVTVRSPTPWRRHGTCDDGRARAPGRVAGAAARLPGGLSLRAKCAPPVRADRDEGPHGPECWPHRQPRLAKPAREMSPDRPVWQPAPPSGARHRARQAKQPDAGKPAPAQYLRPVSGGRIRAAFNESGCPKRPGKRHRVLRKPSTDPRFPATFC